MNCLHFFLICSLLSLVESAPCDSANVVHRSVDSAELRIALCLPNKAGYVDLKKDSFGSTVVIYNVRDELVAESTPPFPVQGSFISTAIAVEQSGNLLAFLADFRLYRFELPTLSWTPIMGVAGQTAPAGSLSQGMKLNDATPLPSVSLIEASKANIGAFSLVADVVYEIGTSGNIIEIIDVPGVVSLSYSTSDDIYFTDTSTVYFARKGRKNGRSIKSLDGNYGNGVIAVVATSKDRFAALDLFNPILMEHSRFSSGPTTTLTGGSSTEEFILASDAPSPAGYRLSSCDGDIFYQSGSTEFRRISSNGWIDSNGVCMDVNECELRTDICDRDTQHCVNVEGGHVCSCKTGYTISPSSRQCENVDECALGLDNCHSEATCLDSDGSFSCTCLNQGTGNGVFCLETDGCEDAIPRRACPNENSSYTTLTPSETAYVHVFENICPGAAQAVVFADPPPDSNQWGMKWAVEPGAAVYALLVEGDAIADPGLFQSSIVSQSDLRMLTDNYDDAFATPLVFTTNPVLQPGQKYTYGFSRTEGHAGQRTPPMCAEDPTVTGWKGAFVTDPYGNPRVSAPSIGSVLFLDMNLELSNPSNLPYPECSFDVCDSRATCNDEPDGFVCTCNAPFRGDGFACSCMPGTTPSEDGCIMVNIPTTLQVDPSQPIYLAVDLGDALIPPTDLYTILDCSPVLQNPEIIARDTNDEIIDLTDLPYALPSGSKTVHLEIPAGSSIVGSYYFTYSYDDGSSKRGVIEDSQFVQMVEQCESSVADIDLTWEFTTNSGLNVTVDVPLVPQRTYVIDFSPFDLSDPRSSLQPPSSGSCSNRPFLEGIPHSVLFNAPPDATLPQALDGTFAAYPSLENSLWTVQAIDCGAIRYTLSLDMDELVGCTAATTLFNSIRLTGLADVSNPVRNLQPFSGLPALETRVDTDTYSVRGSIYVEGLGPGTDEGYVRETISLSEVCIEVVNGVLVEDLDVDGDGDGFPICNDCDDSDPNNYPGNREVCDGKDNDCNGLDDFGQPGVGGQEVDIDSDGAAECHGFDGADLCPNDGNKIVPGVCGCGTVDDDYDEDGMIACSSLTLDACPQDRNKSAPGVCGCGEIDEDLDSDGIVSCVSLILDTCPEDPNKSSPGLCGCGIQAEDSDSDGVGACDGIALEDICPNDPGKTRPGLCGCGDAETDGDGDGVSSCSGPMEFDACPDDSAKIGPGLCGCGVEDMDTDSDGVVDCLDACVDDERLALGSICGCNACTSNNPCGWIFSPYVWDAVEEDWKDGQWVYCGAEQ